jgi:hypothetical protein
MTKRICNFNDLTLGGPGFFVPNKNRKDLAPLATFYGKRDNKVYYVVKGNDEDNTPGCYIFYVGYREEKIQVLDPNTGQVHEAIHKHDYDGKEYNYEEDYEEWLNQQQSQPK